MYDLIASLLEVIFHVNEHILDVFIKVLQTRHMPVAKNLGHRHGHRHDYWVRARALALPLVPGIFNGILNYYINFAK